LISGGGWIIDIQAPVCPVFSLNYGPVRQKEEKRENGRNEPQHRDPKLAYRHGETGKTVNAIIIMSRAPAHRPPGGGKRPSWLGGTCTRTATENENEQDAQIFGPGPLAIVVALSRLSSGQFSPPFVDTAFHFLPYCLCPVIASFPYNSFSFLFFACLFYCCRLSGVA